MRPDRPIAPFLRAVETSRAEIPAAAFLNPARKRTVAKMAESNGKTAAHPQAPPQGAVSNPRDCAPFGLAQSAPIPFNRPGRFDPNPDQAAPWRLRLGWPPPKRRPKTKPMTANLAQIGRAARPLRNGARKKEHCHAMLFFLFFAAPRAEARSPGPHPPAEACGRAAPNKPRRRRRPAFPLPPPQRGRRWEKGRGRGARLRASTPAPARPR